jgi:restriction system protein
MEAFLWVMVFVGGFYWLRVSAISNQEKQEELKKQEEELIKALNKYITKCFNKHKKTLMLKLRQSLYQDDYGNLKKEDFDREVEYFIKEVLYPYLAFESIKENKLGNYALLPNFVSFVDTKLTSLIQSEFKQSTATEEEASIDPSILYDALVTGEDYEKYVGRILENAGWAVNYTPRTGDQGVDVIASIADIKVAIQCKFYKNKVGNKAVQEAHSGSVFYNANFALVVSPSELTKSAKQLASNTGVHYCHHDFLVEALDNITISAQRNISL